MAVVDVAHGVVGLAESVEEVDEPVRKNSNLPKNHITGLPVQDLDGRNFGGCSPERLCMQSRGCGRLESNSAKKLVERERERSV
jgi:hypothetical protein